MISNFQFLVAEIHPVFLIAQNYIGKNKAQISSSAFSSIR